MINPACGNSQQVMQTAVKLHGISNGFCSIARVPWQKLFGVKRAVQPPGFVGGLTAIDKACRAWPNVQKRRAKHANPSVILLAPNRFGDIARGQFQNAVCNKPICPTAGASTLWLVSPHSGAEAVCFAGRSSAMRIGAQLSRAHPGCCAPAPDAATNQRVVRRAGHRLFTDKASSIFAFSIQPAIAPNTTAATWFLS